MGRCVSGTAAGRQRAKARPRSAIWSTVLRNSRRLTMNHRSILGVVALTVLGLAVTPGIAIAQQEMLKALPAAMPTPEMRQALAPSGKLRVGVYRGSPF